MRLLIKLRCTENCTYEMQYHYYLQGFIYNLLKDSRYHYLHDKEGYKFFCFSNIFPVRNNLEKDNLYTLLISSPDQEFITYLFEVLKSFNSSIKIGVMKFQIEFIDNRDLRISDNFRAGLIAGTPIIVRIPREKYKEYDITPAKDYPYIYWKQGYPIMLLLSQLENNLKKKFVEFLKLNSRHNHLENCQSNQTSSSPYFFQKFKFRKQISTRINIHTEDSEQIVIGTTWEFEFNMHNNIELIQFALDCGLGERNSLGFGFMNLSN